MTSHEFVAQILKLQTDNELSDAKTASALAGLVISLCDKNGGSPVAFIQWAMRSGPYIRGFVTRGPASIKLGMTVEFDPKVFEYPYAPYYDSYKGRRFEVIAFHPLGHVEITCVDDPSVRVKGHVHDDELVGVRGASV